MKKIILPILLALCCKTLVASSDEAYKPEFKVVRVYNVHGTRGSCTTSTSLYLDNVCYCTSANEIIEQFKNAREFYNFDEITIFDTDDADTISHKLGVKEIQNQVKRFFEGAEVEAKEKFSSPTTQQIEDYINGRFHELFKVIIEQH